MGIKRGVEKQWAEHAVAVPLEIVRTRTGMFTNATLGFIDELERRWEGTQAIQA